MTPDRPLLGIALMLGFCVLAPLADAMAKLIGDALPLAQLVAVRFGMQAVLLVPLVWALGLSLRVPRGLWPLMILRTALHIVGIGLMFLALRYLPLADAIAIAYVMPFIVLLLGSLVLQEVVGWRRLGACIVGFAGTLLVMQPSFDDVGLVVLMPLGVAVIFAVFMLMTRRIARAMGALELQAVNGLVGSVLTIPLVWLADGSGMSELDPAWPEGRLWALLLALGVLGTLAHLVLTWSLRVAPTSTVAPVQYAEIPMAALLGLLIFAEFPDGLALVGIAIVAAAGLYVVLREQALAKAARRAARATLPPTPPWA